MASTVPAESIIRAGRTSHLLLESLLGWKRGIPGLPVPTAPQTSQPARRGGAEADPGHAPPQSRPEYGGIVARGYTRRPKSLFRVMRKLGLFPSKVKKPAYTPNPYQHMTYPGQRIQVDVKVVPAAASQAMSCAYTNTQLLTSLHACVFGRLPGTVHLFLRKFPEKVVRVTCPLGNPCGMRPDG